jgi:hypothetical protein
MEDKMAGITDDLNAVKILQQGLVNNKVTRFAYEQSAYDNNEVDGQTDYVYARANNIPTNAFSVMQVNQTVVDKGFRARASSMPRMLLNHIFGRVSYNLNKINDLFMSVINSLVTSIGAINGLVPLDSNGRIPYQYLPEDAIELKGTWNASTNTPTLADGTGTLGDTYIVSVAGRQDLGSGSIYFFVGDRVIYNGSIWQRFASGDVKTVCEIPPDSTGNVNLALQTDMSKIFPSDFLTLLFQPLIGKIWGHVNLYGLSGNVIKVIYADGVFLAIINVAGDLSPNTGDLFHSYDGYTWVRDSNNDMFKDIAWCPGTWTHRYLGVITTGAWCAVSDNGVYRCAQISGNMALWEEWGLVPGAGASLPINFVVPVSNHISQHPVFVVGSYMIWARICDDTVTYYGDWVEELVNYTHPELSLTCACIQYTNNAQAIYCWAGSNVDDGYAGNYGLWYGQILNGGNSMNKAPGFQFNFTSLFCFDEHSMFWCTKGNGLYYYLNTTGQASGVPATDTVYSIDYANGLYVCSADSGIYWSADGTNWTQATGVVAGKRINKVLFGASAIDSRWVAGSQSDGLFWSDDGKTWFPGNGESTSNFVTVAHGEGGWVAGGANGLAHSDSANVSDYFADGGTV